mmetsp:Transcript_14809/g.17127  ORF Transcript_14809/g.17127 Transcript_14809/m.17127 type:complete len:382 (-) Transcript_14809:24-1169(-)|eukprot:CAMPEP_0168334396 /NCGR_PEP_ID=MMETSP0213-20121227/10241_1 /TAXON_ID=151035 /ORGANISM="Euplotes harpa, Strain FSP1.4" /LENGTH=381 /DNA_ID=CAMNT_0008339029 /DNA_START=194 /DNA_END=1339 /DNA_ORIENTATION=+
MTAGYKFETHKIVTKDDYINTAWRIVGKLEDKYSDPHPERKPCVILQHGLMDNSATWLIPNKTIALPFRLVDEGYDVWMTNSRGNINSYEHMNPAEYNVKDISSDYFKFSWDEMAKYDVSSNVDYVLAHSNHKKVFYVGHSQGTTQFFGAADVLPGLEDKISGFVGLAPVMYIGNIVSPFIWVAAHSGAVQLLNWLRIYNFFIMPNYINPLLRWFAIHFPRFVWRLLGLVMGIDEMVRVDLTRMPVMLNHEPGGTSYFNMLHWYQSFLSGDFKMLDFGSEEENLKHYGQKMAPHYNTTHIAETFSKIPSLLFAGENDSLVAPRDLVKLQRLLLPSGVKFVILEHYAHADYIWGDYCKELIFDPAVDFIKSHTENFIVAESS